MPDPVGPILPNKVSPVEPLGPVEPVIPVIPLGPRVIFALIINVELPVNAAIINYL
jgi:hypothetical protein